MTKRDYLPALSLAFAMFVLAFFWCFYISIPCGLLSMLIARVSFKGKGVDNKRYAAMACIIVIIVMLFTSVCLIIPKTSTLWKGILDTLFVYLF